jgi:hypothetical protein
MESKTKGEVQIRRSIRYKYTGTRDGNTRGNGLGFFHLPYVNPLVERLIGSGPQNVLLAGS